MGRQNSRDDADDEQNGTALDDLEPGRVVELTYNGSNGSRTVRAYIADIEESPGLLDDRAVCREVRLGVPDDYKPRFFSVRFTTTEAEEDSGVYDFEDGIDSVRSLAGQSSDGQRLGFIEDLSVTDESDARGVEVAAFENSVPGDRVQFGDREATVLDDSGISLRVEFENGDRENAYVSPELGVYYSVIDADDDYSKTTHSPEFQNTARQRTPSDGARFLWNQITDSGHGKDLGAVETVEIAGDSYEVLYRHNADEKGVRLLSADADEADLPRKWDTLLELEPLGLRLSTVYGGSDARTLDSSEVELVYEADETGDSLDPDEDDDREDPTPSDALDREAEVPAEGETVRVEFSPDEDDSETDSGTGQVEAVRISPGEGVEIALSGLFDRTASLLLHVEDPDSDRLLRPHSGEGSPAGVRESVTSYQVLGVQPVLDREGQRDRDADPLLTDGGQPRDDEDGEDETRTDKPATDRCRASLSEKRGEVVSREEVFDIAAPDASDASGHPIVRINGDRTGGVTFEIATGSLFKQPYAPSLIRAEQVEAREDIEDALDLLREEVDLRHVSHAARHGVFYVSPSEERVTGFKWTGPEEAVPEDGEERARFRGRLIATANGEAFEGLNGDGDEDENEDDSPDEDDDPPLITDGGGRETGRAVELDGRTFPAGSLLVLVGCGKSKRDDGREHYARDLYTSTYFQAKAEFSEAVADVWYILSARHGLIHPNRPLSAYDLSLDDLDDEETETWRTRVVSALQVRESMFEDRGIEGVVVLAGPDYVEPINSYLDELDYPVLFPTDGMGLGDRINRLQELTPSPDSTLDKWTDS